jgi:hypothetical protein
MIPGGHGFQYCAQYFEGGTRYIGAFTVLMLPVVLIFVKNVKRKIVSFI